MIMQNMRLDWVKKNCCKNFICRDSIEREIDGNDRGVKNILQRINEFKKEIEINKHN